MKLKLLSLFCILSAALFAAPAPKDTLKLDLAHCRDLADALMKLDGTPTEVKQPDTADGKPTPSLVLNVPFELKGSTRLAIARDTKALGDAINAYMDAWKAYLKQANITDELKETPKQKSDVNDLLMAPTQVKLVLFDETEFETADSKANPIPPTILTRLLPLIRQ